MVFGIEPGVTLHTHTACKIRNDIEAQLEHHYNDINQSRYYVRYKPWVLLTEQTVVSFELQQPEAICVCTYTYLCIRYTHTVLAVQWQKV